MPTTSLGYRYPSGTDGTDGPGAVQRLAEDVDASPGVSSLSGATIAGLTGALKRAGRLVWNSTTARLQVSDGATWEDVPVVAASTPLDISTSAAAVGTSTTAARADHVHTLCAHDHSTTAKGGSIPQASVTGLSSPSETYTPEWRTATGGAPAVGSGGAVQGRYVRVGKLVHFWIKVFTGMGGASFGSDAYIVTLPSSAARGADCGTGYVNDNSASRDYQIRGVIPGAGTVLMLVVAETGARVSPTVPVTMACPDIISISGFYEEA